MRESFLKLNDRTVVLAGPMTQITSAIVTTLSERGSDVAMIVTESVREAQRFAENISEQREIHHNYGRVAAIESPMDSPEVGTEAISRVAEIFGSIDILIDTHLVGVTKSSIKFDDYSKRSLIMAQASLPYLEGRQKGRIIVLSNDFLIKEESQQSDVEKLIRELGTSIADKNITTNVLSCGITEEYLLEKFDGKLSIKDAFAKVQSNFKNARMVDAIEIAGVVTFIASPVSSGISGQTISINAGLIV